ncbi:hypothetical protein GCL60_16980 (plasmid) [Silvanigrella paludirubra]|uniref:Uncharacterized protein n=1 Tax=Silvanigrella paludirubra TaxID=2499159 RepID=A0A6N6VTI9_9BACT|nr:hypothetical protein [Silvanigrella paludirubra]KAB8035642.1 hypothetical protein GCL60_16980 [Silvanigrella paludirubra]
MEIIIDNDLKCNNGMSREYNNIKQLIFDNKMDELDTFVKQKSLDKCYKIVSEKFKISQAKYFHHYLYNNFYVSEVELHYPELKIIYHSNDKTFEGFHTKYILDDSALLPEGLLNAKSLKEISKYITNFEDTSFALIYVFNDYGNCMYNYKCAQILRNMYKIIEKNILDELFIYIKSFSIKSNLNFINFLSYFENIDFIIALNKLLSFKKKEEICEIMFHISSWNKYNIKKHEYEFNENIFNLFSCVLNDCEHYKHKRTNDLFNIELNRSRINYNNIKNNIKVIGEYYYFAI